MRRLALIAVAASLLIALFAPAPSYASHARAYGEVWVENTKNGRLSEIYTNSVECNLAECHVYVTLPKNVYSTFTGIWGATYQHYINAGLSSVQGSAMYPKGPKRLWVRWSITDSSGSPVTHTSAVSVTIHAVSR